MKKLLKPLIVLIVLVAVWVVVQLTGRDLSRPTPEVALEIKLDTVRVNRVEISRGTEQVTLLKGPSGWQVNTPAGIKPAENDQVLTALNNLNGISTTDIVSHNPEKHAEFRVNDSTGTRVHIVGQGDALLEDLVIGKLGGFESQQMAMQMGRINERDFHTFMRRQGSNQVFRVGGFFGGMLGTDSDQWRDHRLLTFEPASAGKINLISPEQKIVLEKDTSGVWAMREPLAAMAVDSVVVERMLASLSTLRATGFIDSTLSAAEMGLEPPAFSAEVRLDNGTTYQVSVGKEIGENLFYCLRRGDSQVYTLAAYRLDQIRKLPDDLLKKEESAESD